MAYNCVATYVTRIFAVGFIVENAFLWQLGNLFSCRCVENDFKAVASASIQTNSTVPCSPTEATPHADTQPIGLQGCLDARPRPVVERDHNLSNGWGHLYRYPPPPVKRQDPYNVNTFNVFKNSFASNYNPSFGKFDDQARSPKLFISWLQKFTEKVVPELAKHVDFKHKVATMIDIGAGMGWLAYAMRSKFPHVQVISTDHPEAISESGFISELGLWTMKYDICQALPMQDWSMDMLHTRYAAFFIPDALAEFVFYEWDRVVRPGGYIAIDSPLAPTVGRTLENMLADGRLKWHKVHYALETRKKRAASKGKLVSWSGTERDKYVFLDTGGQHEGLQISAIFRNDKA